MAAGAGLLLLSDDNDVEHVLDFDAILPDAKDEEFATEVTRLRAELMSKLDLNQGEIRSRFERIGELTAGMSEEVASSYRKGMERLYRQWSDWSDDIGRKLDSVLSERDAARLSDLREAIEAGPLLDDDV